MDSNVIEDYKERKNRDYKSLPISDQKIIDEINNLLKLLSEKGKDYWEEYYR